MYMSVQVDRSGKARQGPCEQVAQPNAQAPTPEILYLFLSLSLSLSPSPSLPLSLSPPLSLFALN